MDDKIDELIKQLKHEHDLYKKHLKVYEDENAKLRECVEFYADKLNWYDNTQINGSDQKAIFKDSEDCLIKSIDKHIVIGGKRARQVLKELEEK